MIPSFLAPQTLLAHKRVLNHPQTAPVVTCDHVRSESTLVNKYDSSKETGQKRGLYRAGNCSLMAHEVPGAKPE